MSSIAENSINLTYTGEVTIRYKSKGKIFEINEENEGLSALFELLSKSLAGYNTTGERPTYIDLRYSYKGEYITFLNQVVPISGLEYKMSAEEGWVTELTAVLSQTNFIEAVSSTEDDTTFKLYLCNDLNRDLAVLDLKRSSLIHVVPGTQALINWVLRIRNATK